MTIHIGVYDSDDGTTVRAFSAQKLVHDWRDEIAKPHNMTGDVYFEDHGTDWFLIRTLEVERTPPYGKIQIACKACGSINVRRDAWAEWDSRQQEWVLQNIFDEGYCEDCEGTSLIEKDLK